MAKRVVLELISSTNFVYSLKAFVSKAFLFYQIRIYTDIFCPLESSAILSGGLFEFITFCSPFMGKKGLRIYIERLAVLVYILYVTCN